MDSIASHQRSEAEWQILRNIGFDGRVRMTFHLSNSLRQISEAGIRSRHPDYSDRQVRLAATKLAIGPELFALVYPGEDVQP
jgi:hypothetical protein